jgi:hypothetical protein
VARNDKIEFTDIEKYLKDGKIELGLKFMGKRQTEPAIMVKIDRASTPLPRTEPAIMVKIDRASTPLPRELTPQIFEAIVRVMVASGYHAKKNERPLDI